MASELTIYQQIKDPLEFCTKMGSALAKSGLLGLPSEEAGAVVMMTCLADRITPVDYHRRYHTIGGKPSMRSDAMLAEFRMNHGGKHAVIEKSESRAAIKLIDREGVESVWEITWDEAIEAGFPLKDRDDSSKGYKDNWDSVRGRKTMLWARVVSDAIRTICPEVNAGVYTPEEMYDIVDAEPQLAARTEIASQAAIVNTEVVKPSQNDQASTSQLMELQNLFVSGKVTTVDKNGLVYNDSLKSVLSKRNCSTVDELTKMQADELIMKLRAKLEN